MFHLGAPKRQAIFRKRGRRGRLTLLYFTAPDGAKIAYQDEGRGRPLLFLHGLMAHGGFFKRQQALSSDFRLITPDFRGHGQSRPGGTEPTVEQLAQDIAALAAELDLGGAIIIGWSLGAAVLWRILAGPEAVRFAGAVVVDMTPRVLNDDEWLLGLSSETCEARRQAIRDDFGNFALAAGAAIFAQPLDEEGLREAQWAGEEFARNNAATMGALWNSLVEEDLRPLLGRIAQPTLVIHGAHSQLYGSGTADYLTEVLPSSHSRQFDRSGHAPHLEQPELFNALVRDFAASLPHVRQQATIV